MGGVFPKDVVAFLADRVVDSRTTDSTELIGQARIFPGRPGCISFASRRDDTTRSSVAQTLSSLVLVLPECVRWVAPEVDFIAVDDPRREFARTIGRYFCDTSLSAIHDRAVIGDSVKVGDGVSVGPGAVITDGCSLGDRVQIGANAVLLSGTVLGDDVLVGPGAVIGQSGFGYVREDDGGPLLMPHHGGVIIGDRVEIGANTTIDRGTIDDTVIEDDAKIDNLVHIAHNCVIGKGAFVIATAILCGSVRVGPRAWIAPNVAIREQISIGADAKVGLSATVIKDVPEGSTVVGSPARQL